MNSNEIQVERELLAEQWRDVAAALGVQCVAPFDLTLADGTQRRLAVLLPQFGGERGMLIDVEGPASVVNAAMALGYGYSSMLAERHHIPVNANDYIESLEDWGWVGPGVPPKWHREAGSG
jgi:hypothetical protein